MPIRWEIDQKKRLMKIVGEGDVTRADLHAAIDAIVEQQALGFRKLVDMRLADTSMTGEEMLEIGARARSVQSLGKSGPLAVVLPEKGVAQAEMLIGMMAAADRPMRVFRDVASAEHWIKHQSARAGLRPGTE
jgi:hypothetical protein